MPTLNGNNAYVEINGRSLGGRWRTISVEAAQETVDITAGSGETHRERAKGLKDMTGSGTIVYDTTDYASDVAALENGGTLIYGPESNTSGKPKLEVDIIVTSISMEQGVEKPLVEVSFDWEATGAPASDHTAGGTFA